jgi:hypothetical protein
MFHPGLAPAGPRHFRAHERREVRLTVEVAAQRSGIRRPAVVIDLSLAGAGIETDEPFFPGDRISVTLATPTMWDPLVIEAVVAWAHPPRPALPTDSLGRSRTVSRSGIVFDHPTPSSVLAMFEMLATIGYE